MDTYVTSETAWLTCSCCGKGIRDTAKENVDHGVVPSPHDTGVGTCVECGGDKHETGTSEAAVRRRLGWAGQTFYDARIKSLPSKLSPANAKHFEAMSYDRKVRVVAQLIERGVIV
jgi:hypothetical protein